MSSIFCEAVSASLFPAFATAVWWVEPLVVRARQSLRGGMPGPRFWEVAPTSSPAQAARVAKPWHTTHELERSRLVAAGGWLADTCLHHLSALPSSGWPLYPGLLNGNLGSHWQAFWLDCPSNLFG